MKVGGKKFTLEMPLWWYKKGETSPPKEKTLRNVCVKIQEFIIIIEKVSQ